MSKTPIIFMDCDGVINNDDFIIEWQARNGGSDESMNAFRQLYYFSNGKAGYVVPELLDRLVNLCDETDCRIVWSSSWRESYWKPDIDTGEFHFDYHGIAELWKAKGFPLKRMIGCTPCLDLSRFSYVPRGLEIQSWIDENKERYNIGNVAILDDNEDAFYGVEYRKARFFQTEFEHGLTEEMACEIKKWLKEQW
jgi:hypothetical protein